VARTAQVYRQAIDDALAGRQFDRHLMDDLENLANRGYTEGFYRRHVHDEYQNYQRGHSAPSQQQFVGEIVDVQGDMMTVEVKNRFACGDTVELMTPGGNRKFVLQQMEDRQGRAVDVASGSGHWVRLPLLPGQRDAQDLQHALLMRDMPVVG
jgi:putative protease